MDPQQQGAGATQAQPRPQPGDSSAILAVFLTFIAIVSLVNSLLFLLRAFTHI